MKYLQEWVTTDTVIQVKALEKGEILLDNAAVFTDAAKEIIRLSRGDKLRVVNHYLWHSVRKHELVGFALKLEESTPNPPSVSTNEVLYLSEEDFDVLCNATNSLQSSDEAIEGFRLEAMPHKPNMVNIVTLSVEEALALLDSYVKGAAILRKRLMASGLVETVVDEKEKENHPAAVKKCFQDPDNILKGRIKEVLEKYKFRKSHTTLARLEIALEDLGKLKHEGKHTIFAKALKSWGLIDDTSKSRCDQISGAYSRIEKKKENDSELDDMKRMINPLSGIEY